MSDQQLKRSKLFFFRFCNERGEGRREDFSILSKRFEMRAALERAKYKCTNLRKILKNVRIEKYVNFILYSITYLDVNYIIFLRILKSQTLKR